MAILPYQVRSKVTHPRTGDDIEYMGGHYIARVRGPQVQVFHDGAYVNLDAGKVVLVSESPVKWKYDPDKKSTAPTYPEGQAKYMVTVNIGGKVDDYALTAGSEGLAKNKAAGIVAKQLGLTIPGVQALLKRPPNSISAKRV